MPGFTSSVSDDALDIEGFAAAQLVTSSSAAQTAALAEGEYELWSSQDTYIKVAPTANDVTTTTGYLLRSNNTISVAIRAGSKIGAIAAGAGTLSYHRVG